MKRAVIFLAALGALGLAGCEDPDPRKWGTGEVEGTEETGTPPVVAADPGAVTDEAFVGNSKSIGALGLTSPVVIDFGDGTAAPAVMAGANATVNADTTDVTVALQAAGAAIVVQGVTGDGSLTVSGNYAFSLYLNGASVTNTDGPAFNNDGTGAAAVVLVSGTTNRFYDTAGNNAVNAAFYSKGALAFASGGGTLEVRGRGVKKGHALAAKGAFTLADGTVWVKEAASDGVNAKSVTVTGGSWTSRTVGDGLQGDDGVSITGGAFSIITRADEVKAHGVKSDGDITIGAAGTAGPTMDITVYGSGAKCLSADGDVAIHSGTLALSTAGNGYWDAEETEADKTTGCAGIKCDGSLLIDGGSVTIVSTGTGGKGISVDGSITIAGGVVDVTTSGATYKYSSAYDTKSKAIKSDNDLTISGGTVRCKTYTDGAEGLECEYKLTISGGLVELETYDDAINASGGDSGRAGEVIISGGQIFCAASGNDGIDSNGTIAISGGTIVCLGSGGGEDGFDCDSNTFTITGGTLIGLGGATSKPTTGVSTQCAVEANVTASTLYHIEDAAGNAALTFKPSRSYSGTVCILFSSPGMAAGTSYTFYSGGGVSGGTDFHGLYSGAVYTKGTSVASFTASTPCATVGTASGSPGAGGRPGTPGAPPGR
ncbi:MAG: carbohydrate-binding domain-containing protein [Treponematales bacterium]